MPARFQDSPKELQFLLLSFLLHALIVGALTLRPGRNPAPSELAPIKVRFERETGKKDPKPDDSKKEQTPELPQKQIVSTPDLPAESPVKETRLRSDRDTKTEVETVRRGDGGPAQPIEKDSQNSNRDSSAGTEQLGRATPRGNADRRPSPAKTIPSAQPKAARLAKTTAGLPTDLLALGQQTVDRAVSEDSPDVRSLERSSENGPKGKTEGDAARLSKLSRYQPFTGGLLPGVPDYLPGVRDGEMTLLNTKADRFAVFVRRVASQVFGLLRRNNWQRIPSREIAQIGQMATVEAVLSPKGELLSVTLKEGSGSTHFDSVLKLSAQGGSWDQNPPPGAVAEDGNIHFVFRSRVWSRPGGPNGQGERRWLLLATGLL